MIYSASSARLPVAEVMDNSSGTSELLDDETMAQYETVNPLDLHYQVDLDSWVHGQDEFDQYLLPWELFIQEDASHPYEDLEAGVSPGIGIQHNPNSEQDRDTLNGSQSAQDTKISENGTPNHDNGCRSINLDDFYQEFLKSNEDFRGPIDVLYFISDLQVVGDEQISNTEIQDEHSPGHFVPGGSLEIVDQPTNFDLQINGPDCQSQEASGRFVEPTSTWIGPNQGLEWLQAFLGNLSEVAPFAIYPHLENKDDGFTNKAPLWPREEENCSNMAIIRRQANIKDTDLNRFYQGLAEAPRSWKPDNCNSNLTFEYNEYGELSGSRFSPNDIYQYLYYHPLNYNGNGVCDRKNSMLTLWIQVTPADSGRRYPSSNSSKCRFENCPIKENSIRKGFFRVAFDEHTASGRQIDPYHCAGFVHLFCLEKFCNFPHICQNLSVLPDQRVFPEGRNRMGLTRDHKEMVEVVRTFMQSSKKAMAWDYEQTLCFRLTSKHLELEPQVRRITREKRGGNHIGLHKGDLDKFVAGETLKKEQRRAAPKAKRPPKRKRETADEEQDIDGFTNPGIQEERPTKRRSIFR